MTTFARHYWLDTRFTTLELLRLPAYSVPSLTMPTMLYLFFGLGISHAGIIGRYVLASYAAFAVIGVALFQFGVGIAHDRASAWESHLRTVPISGTARLAARLTSALVFAGAAAALVIFCGVFLGHISLAPVEWVRFIGALLIGGTVFGAAGMVIGYWTTPKTSAPITNFTYLPLAFIGGLWLPPQYLPKIVAAISPWTPTRQFGELVWSSVSGQHWQPESLEILAGYAVLLAAAAVAGYRRDQAQRYG